MSRFRPSAQEERWSRAAARFGVGRSAAYLAARLGGWTRVGTVTRCAFFALGVVAAALTAAILGLLHLAGSFLVSGIVLLVVAEWLILGCRLFGTGLEEALYAAGVLMIVFQLLGGGSDPHFLRTALLVAVVLGASGLRLLNPLFTTLAVLAGSYALDAFSDVAQLEASDGGMIAATFCFATGVGALLSGARRFERPSHDRMLDWLVVVLPLAGSLWLAPRDAPALTLDSLRHPTVLALASVLVPAGYGLAALLTGIRRRTHAPLLACLVCLGCIGYRLREFTGLPLQLRLIVWGAAALLVTVALERCLRTPWRGITSATLERGAGGFNLLPLVGAGALTPHAVPAPGPSQFKGGGGTFSGGGASGDL